MNCDFCGQELKISPDWRENVVGVSSTQAECSCGAIYKVEKTVRVRGEPKDG